MSRPQAKAGRWPDLLIGLLVLLLLAGFAALLLGQRPEVAEAPTTGVTDSAPVIPTAPGSDLSTSDVGTGDGAATAVTPAPTATAQDSGSTAAPDTATANPPADDSAPTTPATATDEPAPTLAEDATTPETVIAAEPIPAAPVAPPVAPVTLPTPTTTIPLDAAPDAPETAAQPTVSAAPRTEGAVATSAQRTPLRSDYRVSLGTFGSEGAAQGAAQGVRALGYTVYPIDLGAQVVAQVGPFADEASARQALADIQRAYPGAVLYPPRGRSLTGGGQSAAVTPPTPVTPAETAPAEPEAAATPPPAASAPVPAAASSPVYLQVGAFDRVESAQRLVGLLRDEGYAPTVNAPEGSKVTVLIGPFSGEALTAAEGNLDANGFDHFRVR